MKEVFNGLNDFNFIWIQQNKEFKFKIDLGDCPIEKWENNPIPCSYEKIVVFVYQKKICSWMAINGVAYTTKENYDKLGEGTFDIRKVQNIPGCANAGFKSIAKFLSKSFGFKLDNIIEESGDKERIYTEIKFLCE